MDFKILSPILTILSVIALYYGVRWILNRQMKGKSDRSLIRTFILFSIILIGVIAIILSLPLGDMKKDVVSLIGILISAVLALSSATFIGNGLAGVMIRMVNSFRPGDFIKVENHFGRVTETGLFHSEIQTENRDLTTLPNLFLVSNPVKVTRSSGTFICGTCSLGYDVNRQLIEKALLKAAIDAELKDPFVRIMELGDFSVVYKVFGLLENIKTVLSAESKLNAMILDCLHDADIEIVSPSFMNQRPVGNTVFIPKKVKKVDKVPQTDSPENLIFDKAEEAESIQKRKEKLAEVEQKIKDLNEALKIAGDENATAEINTKINKWLDIKTKMQEKINIQIDDMNAKK